MSGNQPIFQISAAKLAELKAELADLKGRAMVENKQAIQEARSQGDLSENGDYDAARNEQAKIHARVTEIEAILGSYEIVSEENLSPDTVRIGSQVTLDYGDGDPDELMIVGAFESDPLNRRIGYDSPVGRALMGSRVGDTVTYEAPAGKISCKIIAVKN